MRNFPDKTSVLLGAVRNELSQDTTTANVILGKLGRRSFGGILILVAGLGLLPGISVFTGLVISILGVQLLCGFKSPVLPKFLTAKKLKSEAVHKVLGKCIQYVEFIEKWLRPRWAILTLPVSNMALGIVIASLGIVMMLPFPFSNLLPAIAVILLSLGQLERDGIMIIIGVIVSVISFAVGLIFAGVALHSLSQFIGQS